ncbi:murein biosynthesis integral membrane protein MurJ [Zooshikella harenae]|uniref:Probable lipid II flippase MurJ n=1 Tax=Zooshikella harenae TaxID=2827238 RepID=A0ABS5Z7V9_9GAMM|nr:murein biosynthesis integral membrane protein MurJ [Zooshikella harenae]MBU2710136.1 murein biosynthesis integral membrane protein MurJ [Zooshikella harenae]
MSETEPSRQEKPAKPSKSFGLLRSSAIVGVMTLLSRVLGLARDNVVANYFGSTAAADAFFVAFKIPNFFRRLFAEGAFSQAFVPVLTEYHTKRSFSEVQELVKRTMGTLGVSLLLITSVGVLAAPLIITIFAPGFRQMPEKLALTADMLQITFPYLMLISLTALCGSVLNSFNRFAIPAFTPVLLNVALILSTLLLTPWFDQPVMALAYGVMLAGIAQLCFQLPFLIRLKLFSWPLWGWHHEGVQRIMKLMVPALFGASVYQLSVLFDTVLASLLESGSISWLYYSERLTQLPQGIFGIAIATVILPSLSRKHAEQSSESFSRTIDWALKLVCLVGIPSALALFILAEPLIATLFHYGAMQDSDVFNAAKSLRAYTLGLVAFMLIKVLATGYFARHDTKTPVRIAIKAMFVSMILNVILVIPLKHAGLALATSLSSLLNAGMLYWGLHRIGVFKLQPGWRLLSLRMLLANSLMILVVYELMADVSLWLSWGWMDRALQVALLVSVGVVTYVAALFISGFRPRHLAH